MSAEAQGRTVIIDNIPEGQRDEVSVRSLCEPVGAVCGTRLSSPESDAEPPRLPEGPGERVFNFPTGFHAVVEFEEEAAALKAPKALTDKSNWRSGLRVQLLVDRNADKMFQRNEDVADRAKVDGGYEKNAGVGGTETIEAPLEGEMPANEGPAFKKPGRKGRKKDYASWAAATPAFRNQAVAQQSGGVDGEGAATGVLGDEAAAARPGLLLPSLGGGRGGGRRQPRMPDGTRGFAMGRGRPMAPVPPS